MSEDKVGSNNTECGVADQIIENNPHWIPIAGGTMFYCSVCRMTVGNKYNFCHNCGADMRERRADKDNK